MASITKDAHQPPKSPYWIACYNGVGSDGTVRRFKRSTKTTDKKLAQKLADEWEALLSKSHLGHVRADHWRTATFPYGPRVSGRMGREQKKRNRTTRVLEIPADRSGLSGAHRRKGRSTLAGNHANRYSAMAGCPERERAFSADGESRNKDFADALQSRT